MQNRINMIQRIFIALLIMFCLTAGSGVASAATYYISTTGNDQTGNGSINSPFKTFEQGASVLRPGDTLYARGGTYQRTTDRWNPPSGTSWNNAVTIAAYPGEEVIVTPNRNTVFAFAATDIQYVIMDGLIMDAQGKSTVINMQPQNHHIRFSNGEMRNSSNSLMQSGKASHLQILNMKIHGSKEDYGIYHNGNFGLIEGNDFYDNGGYGLHLWSSTGTVNDNIIINNRFHNNGWVERPGSGGLRGGMITGGGNARNQIINNVFSNNPRGLIVMKGNGPDTKVYNNTFYGNSRTGLLVNDPKTDVRNNLSYNNGEGNPIVSGATASNNLFGTDPKFTNASGGDFSLQAGSPAIGAGVNIPGVTTPGPSGNPDIGATPSGLPVPASGGGSSGGSCTTGTPATPNPNGQTFYVSPGGGGGDGSAGSPFGSLREGIANLSPGDTLYLNSGTYTGSSAFNNLPGGTSWDAATTIAAAPGATVTLKRESGANSILHTKPDQEYITFDGLIFDGERGGGGNIVIASEYIRIMNSEVKDSGGQGILLGAGSGNGEFINLNVHTNGWTPHWGGDGSPGSRDFNHGIYVNSSNNLIKDSQFNGNFGTGIHVFGTNTEPSNNIIINNQANNNAAAGRRGKGIIVTVGNNNIVANNELSGNRSGLVVNWGASNTSVCGNNSSNNDEYGVLVDQKGGTTGTLVGPNTTSGNGVSDLRSLESSTDLNFSGCDALIAGLPASALVAPGGAPVNCPSSGAGGGSSSSGGSTGPRINPRPFRPARTTSTPRRSRGDCSPGIPCVVAKGSGQNAPKTANPTCDADFMNQIYARAFLEAERENIINETVIRKPDSILEYSCFDDFVSRAADHAGPLFTETDEFEDKLIGIGLAIPALNISIPFDDFTDGFDDLFEKYEDKVLKDFNFAYAETLAKLQEIKLPGGVQLPELPFFQSEGLVPDIGELLDQLIAAIPSFSITFGTYMGDEKLDRSLENLVLESLESYTDDNFGHDFLGGAAGINGDSGYGCATMNAVWHLAKCRNFALDDALLSFDNIANTDPRLLPRECSGEDAPLITLEIIDVADNQDFQYVEFKTLDVSHFRAECGEPISTGVAITKIIFQTNDNGIVTSRDKVSYDGHICSSPGCYYNAELGICED